jgi:hypothetical protein
MSNARNIANIIAGTYDIPVGSIEGVVNLGKNRIINGDMRIDQRNNGAAIPNRSSGGDGAGYAVDRFRDGGNGFATGRWTVQQLTDAPPGFINSFGVTVTTAQPSLSSTDFLVLAHMVEGFNISDFAWGTASARTVALSFWVKSSVVGTYSVTLQNGSQNYNAPYTISTANTWERKTIIIPGPTTGTWATNNALGVRLDWCLVAATALNGPINTWTTTGSNGTASNVNILATNGNTFRITGVQLEVGNVATAFDYLDYGRQLQQCQRYYTTNNFANPGAFISAAGVSVYTFETYKVTMRATPTVTTALCQSQASAGAVTNRTFNLSNNNANGFSPQLATSDPLCYITYQANIEL